MTESNSFPLAGKRIVVTGSSSGIGRAVALRLAREGARVLVNASGLGDGGRAKSEEGLAALVGELEALGSEALAFVGSVADDSVARQMIDRAAERFGGLDGLVNCAGVPEPPRSSALEMAFPDWQSVRRVHLDGTFSCCRHALPHLLAAGGGSILNTTSHAFLGLYGGSAYGAAKGGVNSLTWALAADYRSEGIRCNAIAPGAKTRLSSGADYEAKIADLEQRGVLTPEMAAISLSAPPPEGCASLYAFLQSDASREISGEIFSATGSYIGVFPKPSERMLAFREADALWSVEELAERIPDALFRSSRKSP